MFDDLINFNKKAKTGEINKNEYSEEFYNDIYGIRQPVDNNIFRIEPGQYVDNNGYSDPSYNYFNPNLNGFNDHYINDMPYLNVKDSTGYSSLFTGYPNDWSRLGYSPTYSNTSNSTLSPKSQDSNQPTLSYDSNVIMSVDLHETLFNRLQWYHITCKFENNSVCLIFIYDLIFVSHYIHLYIGIANVFWI